jgi:hypothetical protein
MLTEKAYFTGQYTLWGKIPRIPNIPHFLAPVDIASKRLGKKVGILNPQTHPAFVLKQAATFFKQIRQGVLRDSQFPHVLTDADGTFRKPASW